MLWPHPMQLTESYAPWWWNAQHQGSPVKPSTSWNCTAHSMSSQSWLWHSHPATQSGSCMQSAPTGLCLDPDKNNMHNKVRRYEANNHTSLHLYGCHNCTKTWVIGSLHPDRCKVLFCIRWYYHIHSPHRLSEEHLQQLISVDNWDKFVNHMHSPHTLLMFINALSKSVPCFLWNWSHAKCAKPTLLMSMNALYCMWSASCRQKSCSDMFFSPCASLMSVSRSFITTMQPVLSANTLRALTYAISFAESCCMTCDSDMLTRLDKAHFHNIPVQCKSLVQFFGVQFHVVQWCCPWGFSIVPPWSSHHGVWAVCNTRHQIMRIYFTICMSIIGCSWLLISLRTDVAWHTQVLGTQHQCITMRWVLSMSTPCFTDGDLGSLLHTMEHHLQSLSNVSRLRSQVSWDHVHYFHPCNFAMMNPTNLTWQIKKKAQDCRNATIQLANCATSNNWTCVPSLAHGDVCRFQHDHNLTAAEVTVNGQSLVAAYAAWPAQHWESNHFIKMIGLVHKISSQKIRCQLAWTYSDPTLQVWNLAQTKPYLVKLAKVNSTKKHKAARCSHFSWKCNIHCWCVYAHILVHNPAFLARHFICHWQSVLMSATCTNTGKLTTWGN